VTGVLVHLQVGHLIPGVYLPRSPSRSRLVVIARSEEDYIDASLNFILG